VSILVHTIASNESLRSPGTKSLNGEGSKYILNGLRKNEDYDYSFFGGDQLHFLFLMKWEGTMALAGPLLVPSLLQT
jgi:hypothetical protein